MVGREGNEVNSTQTLSTEEYKLWGGREAGRKGNTKKKGRN